MPTPSKRSLTSHDDRIVQGLAVVAALVAGFAPGRPTGLAVADGVLQAVLAGLVTLAGGRARRWSVLWLAALATASASGWTFLLALPALLVAVGIASRRERLRIFGALAAALAAVALLWQDSYLFHGASVLLGSFAVLPVVLSAHRRTRRRVRRRNLIAVGVAGALAALAVLAFVVTALLASDSLRKGADDAQAALAAARRGETAEAEQHLAGAEDAFRSADRYTGGIWAQPVRVVPLAAQQAAVLREVTEQGLAMTAAGGSVARVGDYQDLRYESGALDLDRVRDLAEPLDRANAVLQSASHQLGSLDREWLLGPVADRLAELDGEVNRAAGDASVAAQAVREAPGLLGADGPRTYFIAFVNPAEERGGGGFLGNYGILTATDGKLELARSGPIRELIDAVPLGQRTLDGPEDYVSRYGQYKPADFLQDVTFSPHFPYTADVISQLYPQSGGTPIDGVISLDPYALAELLTFTGPIDVDGFDEPLTSDNAADIILRQQYLRFGDDDNAERKDLLVEASKITFDRLTEGSLPGPKALVDVLGPMVRQRRLQLAAIKPFEQDLFATIGADGALPAVDGGDVFMVAHQNFGNSKIDAFLQRTVRYKTEIDATSGEATATATITLRNDAPAGGLPRIVIGNNQGEPPGTNMMLLSIYSAFDLEGAMLDGQDLYMVSGTEAGLSTYTARIDVAPSSTRVLEVKLRGGIDLSDDHYDLTIVPQAMVEPDEISVEARIAGGGMKVSSVAGGAERAGSNTVTATAEPGEVLSMQADLGPG